MAGDLCFSTPATRRDPGERASSLVASWDAHTHCCSLARASCLFRLTDDFRVVTAVCVCQGHDLASAEDHGDWVSCQPSPPPEPSALELHRTEALLGPHLQILDVSLKQRVKLQPQGESHPHHTDSFQGHGLSPPWLVRERPVVSAREVGGNQTLTGNGGGEKKQESVAPAPAVATTTPVPVEPPAGSDRALLGEAGGAERGDPRLRAAARLCHRPRLLSETKPVNPTQSIKRPHGQRGRTDGPGVPGGAGGTGRGARGARTSSRTARSPGRPGGATQPACSSPRLPGRLGPARSTGLPFRSSTPLLAPGGRRGSLQAADRAAPPEGACAEGAGRRAVRPSAGSGAGSGALRVRGKARGGCRLASLTRPFTG